AESGADPALRRQISERAVPGSGLHQGRLGTIRRITSSSTGGGLPPGTRKRPGGVFFVSGRTRKLEEISHRWIPMNTDTKKRNATRANRAVCTVTRVMLRGYRFFYS